MSQEAPMQECHRRYLCLPPYVQHTAHAPGRYKNSFTVKTNPGIFPKQIRQNCLTGPSSFGPVLEKRRWVLPECVKVAGLYPCWDKHNPRFCSFLSLNEWKLWCCRGQEEFRHNSSNLTPSPRVCRVRVPGFVCSGGLVPILIWFLSLRGSWLCWEPRSISTNSISAL